MDKHIKYAVEEWIKKHELVSAAACMAFKSKYAMRLDYHHYHDKQGRCLKTIALDLSWWREIPIRDWYEYDHQIGQIIMKEMGISEVRQENIEEYKKRIHNATIEQRCEAKYKADNQ